MQVNQAGLKIIEDSESIRLTAYQDSAGIWTIGWGHTGGVFRGQVISRLTADSLLISDTQKAQDAILSLTKVPLTSNQFSALVSLVFNIGGGQYKTSSVLKYLNAGKVQQAADAFLLYDKAKNKKTKKLEVLGGLVIRRGRERALFLQK